MLTFFNNKLWASVLDLIALSWVTPISLEALLQQCYTPLLPKAGVILQRLTLLVVLQLTLAL
ncbi:hypothetical protein AMTR_s04298p00005260, partial [Amborella trichopoda]